MQESGREKKLFVVTRLNQVLRVSGKNPYDEEKTLQRREPKVRER